MINAEMGLRIVRFTPLNTAVCPSSNLTVGMFVFRYTDKAEQSKLSRDNFGDALWLDTDVQSAIGFMMMLKRK